MKNNQLKIPKYVKDYNLKGYAIIKNLFSKNEIKELGEACDIIYSEGMLHPRSFRNKNLLYLIQSDPKIGKVLRFCQWPSYSNSVLEKFRTDLRFLKLLKPLIGNNQKQIINQIIWKTPGANQTSYGFHQDARFRRPESAYRDLANSFVQTALAIDRHTVENGCLTFIEGSHLLGNIKYNTAQSVYEENISEEVLEKLGIDHLAKVNILLEPGDLAMWHPYLLHGSGLNNSSFDRRAYLNGYVMAENCDRGEWAFRDGQPVPLSEPVLVQYDALYKRPEPHYIHGAPHPIKK